MTGSDRCVLAVCNCASYSGSASPMCSYNERNAIGRATPVDVALPITPGEFGGSDDYGRKREEFPSLSLMSRPITPAPPRLRPFHGIHGMTWRCRVEAQDICRHRHITPSGLTCAHYDASIAEGWGDTTDRAYTAWKSKWRALNEPGATP